MTAPATRLLPLALVAVLAACSPGNTPEDDGTEQEQAITAAQQAAESAKVPPPNGAADSPPPARADAGAKTVRVLEPDQMVTMEFDGERLNIEVDATKKIVAVRCG